MKKIFIGTMLMAFSLNALAENVNTTTTITKMYTYGEDIVAQHNDIVIQVKTSVAGCEDGFWLKSTDNLATNNISAFLLSAFHANSKVYLAGYTDQRWNGSTGKYCKLHSIGLEK